LGCVLACFDHVLIMFWGFFFFWYGEMKWHGMTWNDPGELRRDCRLMASWLPRGSKSRRRRLGKLSMDCSKLKKCHGCLLKPRFHLVTDRFD
jgi:hypothetical protein